MIITVEDPLAEPMIHRDFPGGLEDLLFVRRGCEEEDGVDCLTPQAGGESDPNWFRQPTPREHRIASMLFGGFGLFFIAFVLAFVFVGDGLRDAADPYSSSRK